MLCIRCDVDNNVVTVYVVNEVYPSDEFQAHEIMLSVEVHRHLTRTARTMNRF